jgi:hypothetical protein
MQLQVIVQLDVLVSAVIKASVLCFEHRGAAERLLRLLLLYNTGRSAEMDARASAAAVPGSCCCHCIWQQRKQHDQQQHWNSCSRPGQQKKR